MGLLVATERPNGLRKFELSFYVSSRCSPKIQSADLVASASTIHGRDSTCPVILRVGGVPAASTQELLAQRREHRGPIARPLPIPRIARERRSLWRLALTPAAHARLALGDVVLLRRIHRDVLRHPHAIVGDVRPDAVREQTVEDQQRRPSSAPAQSRSQSGRDGTDGDRLAACESTLRACGRVPARTETRPSRCQYPPATARPARQSVMGSVTYPRPSE